MITNEELAEIVKNSISFSEAARKAGRPDRGASLQFFSKRIKSLGLDTSHFLGKRAHTGSRHTGVAKKKEWEELLNDSGIGRLRSNVLRRAYKEYCASNGLPEQCSECNLPPVWNGKKLRLQIHHKNEVNSHNRPENLVWICPNCHSQKHFAT